jgi:hypothetical protein
MVGKNGLGKRRIFDGKLFESVGTFPKEIAELTVRIIQRDGTDTRMTHSFMRGYNVWREVREEG